MSALVPFRESIESSAALFDGVVVNNADAEVLENLAVTFRVDLSRIRSTRYFA